MLTVNRRSFSASLLLLEFLIRKSEYEEVGLETNKKAVLEDIGQNADLYIANQPRGQHTKLGAWLALSFEQRQILKS